MNDWHSLTLQLPDGIAALSLALTLGIAGTTAVVTERRNILPGVLIQFLGALLVIVGAIGYFPNIWPEPYLGSLLPDPGVERAAAREGLILGLALLGRRNLIGGLGKVLAMARGAVSQSDFPPRATDETDRPDTEPSPPDGSDTE